MSAWPHSQRPADTSLASRATLSQRALAVIWGLVSLPAAVLCLIAAMLAAGLLRQPGPRPIIVNDPCCRPPDSWGDVAIGVVATPTLLATGVGLLVAFAALLAFTSLGRWPAPVVRWRRVLLRLAAFCVAGLAVLFCALLVAALNS